MKKYLLCHYTLLIAHIAVALCAPGVLRAQAPTGSVTGQVNDAESGLFLYSVQVQVAGTNLMALTDREGRFRFDRLPAGSHEIVFTYTGSETLRKTAEVRAGAETRMDVELRTDMVLLEKFVVAGEREGDAASITRQRNAPNVTNVIAIDALGRMTNENTGELLMRLPGIVGEIGEYGDVESVTIRGIIGQFNNMTVDGVQQGNTYTERRIPRTDMLSGALFEEIEVVKSHTPDMPADGLGGAVNIRTRGPLTMKEKRRTYYRLGARYAASFYDHVPLRDGHLLHPLFNITHNEVFDAGSGSRNLGMSLNLLYSERASSHYLTRRSYEQTMESPAFVYSHRAGDMYNNRKQMQASLRLEYKLSESSKIWMSLLYADSQEPWITLYQDEGHVRLEEGRIPATLGPDGKPNGGGSIVPGYTDNVTTIWGPSPAGGANSTRFIATSQVLGWDARERQITLGGEFRDGPLQVEYTVGYFRSISDHNTPKNGDRPAGGVLQAIVYNPWLQLDTRESLIHPVFTQVGGAASIHDPNAYTYLELTARDSVKFNKNFNASIDAKYVLSLPTNPLLKAGVYFRRQKNGDTDFNHRRWTSSVAGLYADLVDPSIVTSTDLRTGNHIPRARVADAAADIYNNPERWTEDLYYNARYKYDQNRDVTETVSAAYAQAQFRLGQLHALAGVRAEHTGVLARGHVESRPLTTTSERTADPLGSAARDYNNPQSHDNSFTHWHPSVHLRYNITRNLLARLSWSNSIGRPRFTELYPGYSVNNTEMRISLNNPNLKPQKSENWDAMLEYYFKPLGSLSAGYFRKDLTGFIVRGHDGEIPDDPDHPYYEYRGYDLYRARNGGDARVEGWEFSWRQKLTFLPGPLLGLTVFANYTTLKTKGDYGSDIDVNAPGAGQVTNPVTDLVGFVPRSLNASLNYSYRGLAVSLSANHRSSFLWAWATEPSLTRFAYSRTTWNLAIDYTPVRQKLTFFLALDNLTNEPVKYYTLRKERLDHANLHDRVINFGIRGSF